MGRIDNLSNQVWLIANDKEAEFYFFCKENDLDLSNPIALQLFINQQSVGSVK